jgi:4-hydroxybenzoyl-CoA thioesterase
MAKLFQTSFPVRFAHCDAAGIIFYPRAFELVNGVVEDWFATGLGKPFGTLHLEDRMGFPLLKLEAVFHSPARLGDILDFELGVTAIGNSSADLFVAAATGGTPRFTIKSRGVFVRLDTGKSVAVPDVLRAAMAEYLQN